ncbi:MAG: tetratricopeptide repeat protein [Firmicutes bacterium]|nr:tetratricopeptide repeat protein [Bacillota bacterium]
MLQLCVSQQLNSTPFMFRSTGIRVYSLEEVMYHVFHYWRESMDDFLSDKMITWVSDLGLSFIVGKIQKIADEKQFATRMLNFIQLIDYFDQCEINELQAELEAWERQCEWQKLKERADYFIQRGEPSKALPFYKRALQLEENAMLLNNIGVMYMQLSAPEDALHYLTRAHAFEPDNFNITLHYIEAAILSGQYESAVNELERIEAVAPNSADIPFFYGLIAQEQEDYPQALAHYEEAIRIDPVKNHYAYKMAEVYKKTRQFEKALRTLSKVPNKDAGYYVKEAEIHAAAGDVPASLRCMRNATDADGAHNANLWAKLAEYYRRDYDWRRAEKAILHALELAPDNDSVRFENARVKKGLGRTREYQADLAEILKDFKERYRTDK